MQTGEESANEWRVRFKTHDGMYSFVDLRIGQHGHMTRSEVERWAARHVSANGDQFASVAKIINLDIEA